MQALESSNVLVKEIMCLLFVDIVVAVNGVWILVETNMLNSK